MTDPASAGARGQRGPRTLIAPLIVTAALTLGLGWLSRAPFQPAGSDDSLLRLSWRLRPPVMETCRMRTQAELDALPVHMRTPEVCEQRAGAYRLVVRIDTLPPDTTRVQRGGAKGDRPLFVLREVPLASGPHRLHIQFEPEDSAGRDPVMRPLALDTVLQLEPGAVALVTLDPEGRTMVVRQSTQQ